MIQTLLRLLQPRDTMGSGPNRAASGEPDTMPTLTVREALDARRNKHLLRPTTRVEGMSMSGATHVIAYERQSWLPPSEIGGGQTVPRTDLYFYSETEPSIVMCEVWYGGIFISKPDMSGWDPIQ